MSEGAVTAVASGSIITFEPEVTVMRVDGRWSQVPPGDRPHLLHLTADVVPLEARPGGLEDRYFFSRGHVWRPSTDVVREIAGAGFDKWLRSSPAPRPERRDRQHAAVPSLNDAFRRIEALDAGFADALERIADLERRGRSGRKPDGGPPRPPGSSATPVSGGEVA